MKPLFLKLWNDEQFVTRWGAALLMLLGNLIASGTVPTFVDGLGPKVGPVVMTIAIAVATGHLKLPRVAEASVTAVAVVAAPEAK